MDHYPVMKDVIVVDFDTGFTSTEVQVRCGCTDSLDNDFGHEF